MSALTLQIRPDAVAVLTIDQPGRKANVLTRELWHELEAMFESLAVRNELVGLVIASAKPGVFIAGADLKLLQDAPGRNDPAVRAFIEHGNCVLFALEALPFPTCAAIDGAALGGGLEVALACSRRVCSHNPRVQLGLPETKLGLIPGWGGTWRLPAIVGKNAAARMLMTGVSLSASEAHEIGLCEIANRANLIDFAAEGLPLEGSSRRHHDDSLTEVPTDATHAVREVLRITNLASTRPPREASALETEAFMNLAGSPESKRLIAEFFKSRSSPTSTS